MAVLLSILLVLILILGAFIIRHKMSRSRNSNDASNYTLGSSSGCTDQLVMTSSPSATHDGMISDGTDSEHFIYISSRNKPHQIYHNRRLSHIIHRNGKFLASKLTHATPGIRVLVSPRPAGSVGLTVTSSNQYFQNLAQVQGLVDRHLRTMNLHDYIQRWTILQIF